MDTKLKNMKTRGNLTVTVGWIGALWIGIMTYTDLWVGWNVVVAAVGIVYGICLTGFTIWWCRTCKQQRLLKVTLFDRIESERVIVGIILTLVGIIWFVPWYHPDNWMYLEKLFLVYLYFLSELLWAVVLYCQIALLIRKLILGIWTQTSSFSKMWLDKKKQLSVQDRLLQSYYWQGSIIGVVCVFVVIMSVCGIYEETLWGTRVSYGLICLLIALLAISYLWQSRIWRDAGKLAKRIYELEHGISADDSTTISRKSILFETMSSLENIQNTLDENVEKRMQSERMKVDLITNVSHDLKTPLTSMVGYTELLKKEELSPVAMDYVDIIADKQEKLAEMIQDLFELSKATSQSEQLDMQVLDMNRLVEQIMADMEDALAECEFTYVKKLAEEPLLFRGDNHKMYRVVQNILENTTKYAMAGTRVFVETSVEQEMVRLQVKNIASYAMDFTAEEIVERFARGDKARTTEGHGLGLAIASSLMENMNGTLEIQVDGDVFKVEIKLKQEVPILENQA